MSHATTKDASLVSSIIDLAADAIITVGPDERILSWNRGAEQMLGWTEDEVLGRHFRMLLPDEEIARGELEWLHEAVMTSGPIRDFETRRKAKDGRIIEVSLTRTAVFDDSGKLLGYSAILRDISDRKRLERQLMASERLVVAGRVAAGVAHEIGAPLTAIAMTVEQMLRQQCSVCAGAERMRVLQSQVDRIARLARQLVDLAKPVAMTRSPVRVNDVVAAGADLVRGQFARQGVRIELLLRPDLPQLSADGGQLQQVMLNVLFNALRFVPANHGAVSIATRRAGPASVEITIADNGSGVAPQDLPHVFTAFFSRSGGSGLGLALAAQIVQAHGGTIEAGKAAEGGALFTITLPAGAAHGA
jgi:PAS domain S-box-containing protein